MLASIIYYFAYMPNDVLLIRDATEDDVETLALLMDDLSYATTVAEMYTRFKAILGHPDYKTILVEANNEIVGMAGLHKGNYYEKNGMYLRVLAFVVKESSRKRGVGKSLIKAIEDWAVEQGLNSVIINSGNRPDRIIAHSFYQKMGYEIKSSGFVKQL